MAQRLKMPHALHGRGNGFLINNAPLPKAGAQIVFVPQRILQDFDLNRSHDPDREIAVLIPGCLQHGLLLFELPQRLHQCEFIHRLSEPVCCRDRAGQDRRQKLLLLVLLDSKSVSCQCMREPCSCHDLARGHPCDLLIPLSGIQAQLTDLLRSGRLRLLRRILVLLPDRIGVLRTCGSLVSACTHATGTAPRQHSSSPMHRFLHDIPDGQRPAGDLHPGKTRAVLSCHLVHQRAEGLL